MSHSEGVAWAVRNEEQRQNFIAHAQSAPLPFLGKIGKVQSPKTLKQIRYAHSLCGALAAFHGVPTETAKRDAKAAFGIVTVGTSLVTGQRAARLKSFADYTKDEMEAFCTQMEVHLSEKSIPFTASDAA